MVFLLAAADVRQSKKAELIVKKKTPWCRWFPFWFIARWSTFPILMCRHQFELRWLGPTEPSTKQQPSLSHHCSLMIDRRIASLLGSHHHFNARTSWCVRVCDIARFWSIMRRTTHWMGGDWAGCQRDESWDRIAGCDGGSQSSSSHNLVPVRIHAHTYGTVRYFDFVRNF